MCLHVYAYLYMYSYSMCAYCTTCAFLLYLYCNMFKMWKENGNYCHNSQCLSQYRYSNSLTTSFFVSQYIETCITKETHAISRSTSQVLWDKLILDENVQRKFSVILRGLSGNLLLLLPRPMCVCARKRIFSLSSLSLCIWMSHSLHLLIL